MSSLARKATEETIQPGRPGALQPPPRLRLTGRAPRDDKSQKLKGTGIKPPAPAFVTSEANGIYGPGHNCFTTEGGANLLVYLARDYRDIQGDPRRDPNRQTRVLVLRWKAEAPPNFGGPWGDYKRQ